MRYLLSALVFSAPLFASVAHISALRGDAIILRDGAQLEAKINAELEAHDVIKTTAKSRLQVIFNDNTVATIGRNTTFKIHEFKLAGADSAMNLEVPKGSFKVISGEISKLARKNFALKADTATIGIRGTVFLGEIAPNASKVACLAGAIDVAQGGVKKFVGAGKQLDYTPAKLGKISAVQTASFSLASNSAADEEPASNSAASGSEAASSSTAVSDSAAAAVGDSTAAAAGDSAAAMNSQPADVPASAPAASAPAAAQIASQKATTKSSESQKAQAVRQSADEAQSLAPTQPDQADASTPAQPSASKQPAAPSQPAPIAPSISNPSASEAKDFVRIDKKFYYANEQKDASQAAKFNPKDASMKLFDASKESDSLKLKMDGDELEISTASGAKHEYKKTKEVEQAGHGKEFNKKYQYQATSKDGKDLSLNINANEGKLGLGIEPAGAARNEYDLKKSDEATFEDVEKKWEKLAEKPSIDEDEQPAIAPSQPAPAAPSVADSAFDQQNNKDYYFSGDTTHVKVNPATASMDMYTTGELKLKDTGETMQANAYATAKNTKANLTVAPKVGANGFSATYTVDPKVTNTAEQQKMSFDAKDGEFNMSLQKGAAELHKSSLKAATAGKEKQFKAQDSQLRRQIDGSSFDAAASSFPKGQ